MTEFVVVTRAVAVKILQRTKRTLYGLNGLQSTFKHDRGCMDAHESR